MVEKILNISSRSVLSALALGGLLWFSSLVLVGYIIPGFQELFAMKGMVILEGSSDLIGVPIISFFLVWVNVSLAVSVFKRLKAFDEEGLKFWFMNGLLGGIFFGVIIGIFGGLFLGYFGALTWGLILGLTAGLAVGLGRGLIDDFY